MFARCARRRPLLLFVLVTLVGGGCPRPEDRLEPNNTAGQATPLSAGVAVAGRVVQGNPDVFSFLHAGGGSLHFALQTLEQEEERCAAFRVVAPDGQTLYDDNSITCSRGWDAATVAPGASLEYRPGTGYDLRVPAAAAGTYYLTISELGYADNVFTFSWHYRLTVSPQ